MKITVLATGEMDPPRRRLPADLVLVRLRRLQLDLGLVLVALEHSLLNPRLEHRLQLHLELQPLLPLVLLRHHRHLVALVLPHRRPAASSERRRQLRLHLGLRLLLQVDYSEVPQLLGEVSLAVLLVRGLRRLVLFSPNSACVTVSFCFVCAFASPP